MDLAIMLEGQMGLTWPRWQRIARLVEDLGFAGLYRSDHFVNPNPPDQASLELWVSLVWLASNTRRIEFGPLVSPVSFRHPALTVRMASAVDDLSGGRLILGIGAGWNEREHHNYSYDLLDTTARFARFEEAAHIITHLLRNDDPLTFTGHYYQFHDAVLLPRPQRSTPILIGGNGERRTLSMVAQYADEWNAVYITAARFAELNARLSELLTARSRIPQTVRRSLMTGVYFGTDDAHLKRLLDENGTTAEEARSRGILVGTPSALKDQLAELAAAGVQRVMLQWLDLDALDRLEALAHAVL